MYTTKRYRKRDPDEHEQLVKKAHEKTMDGAVEIVLWLRDRKGIHVNLEDGHQAEAADLFEIVLEQRGLPPESENIFSVWLVSPLLELRLKNHHKPFQLAQLWDDFCAMYTDSCADEITRDEPVVMFQRNVFLTLEEEMKTSNETILCLLYHEAKFNVAEGRYIMDPSDYHALAGIQALIHLGHFDPKNHVTSQYRANLSKFYPPHMYKFKLQLLHIGKQKERPCEEIFMEAHKQISANYREEIRGGVLRDLYRQYLQICWKYSCYGSAFFEGVIEKPCHKVKKAILGCQQTEVLVAINTDGVTVTDKEKPEVILAVPYEELSWNLDTNEDEDDLIPCLLVQFLCKEGSSCNTKVLQIYSRQAKLMDALIDSSVKRKLQRGSLHGREDYVNGEGEIYRNENFCRKVENKMEKMCLTTYSLEETRG